MKRNIIIGFWILMSVTLHQTYGQNSKGTSCNIDEPLNPNYSRAHDLQQAMDELVRDGAPGCVLAVYSEEGWWASAAGVARIEDNTPMQVCNLQYLQSISKTYMAVAVLKLYEQGKIDLDAPFTDYLPERYSHYITGADKITVRMLLNHTSGVPEYNFAPAYVARLLQHPEHYFVPEDYLKYIDGKPLDFVPGSQYSYRNTNYVILAMMTDAITGDHAKFITETIFTPLGLKHTYYRNEPGYLKYPELPDSYWDRHGNGIVENASVLQKNNVAAMVGDDGIVCTPVDAVKFLRGLQEGKLLSKETLEQMQPWINHWKEKPARSYGLGIGYKTIQGHIVFGHTGGGIGAGCELYYFPEKNLYMFVAINLGTVTESPLHGGIEKKREKLFQALVK